MNTESGRVPDGTGLSQAEPVARLGPSGFDPSRKGEEAVSAAAEAVMRTRVQFGWTFGKRPAVMAIDILMAEAALGAGLVTEDVPPFSRRSMELIEELQQFGAAHNRNGERRTADVLFRAADRIRKLERKAHAAIARQEKEK